jgi:outer membrane protein assembly factor BamA
MRRALVLALLVGSTALPRAAEAQTSWPQKVRAIRVYDNTKTATGTVIELAGISEGEEFTPDQIEVIKSRLINAGLFSDVNVYYEPQGDGVRVNIVARDKFAWFAAPTFSASTGNVGGGLAFGHTNLFGRNKKMLAYGAIFSSDSRLLLVYQDPALFGSWFFWRVDAGIARSRIDEFNLDVTRSDNLEHPELFRRTPVWSGGGGVQLGVTLPAGIRGSLYYRFANVTYETACVNLSCSDSLAPNSPLLGTMGLPDQPGNDGNEAYLHLDLGYDSTVNTWGIRTGWGLGGWYEVAASEIGSHFAYQKYGGNARLGLRFFEEHNLILRGGFGRGDHLPFYEEFEAGGSSLRGYNYREFRGDTSADGHAEYYIPFFWAGSMAVRGLVFVDSQAVWFRDDSLRNPDGSSPVLSAAGTYLVRHPDGTTRSFLPEVDASGAPHPPRGGLNFDHWHTGLGAGIRLYLKSINIPLLGFDFGYGLQSKDVSLYIALGLTD